MEPRRFLNHTQRGLDVKQEPVVTEAEFLKHVASHAMTIERDDGVYRHLIFAQPANSWHHRFEIVTWPGALCIRGDMGTYVFSRVTDMFAFFRHSTQDGRLYINDGYWAEKLIASECNGRRSDGVERFDPDIFRDAVNRWYAEHVRHNMRGMPDERRSLRLALEEEVLAYADAGEHEAMRAACTFEHEGVRMTDFWEVGCRRYTVQFIWSLYAIAWAIRCYDERHGSSRSDAA